MNRDTKWVLANFPALGLESEGTVAKLIREAKDSTGMLRLYVLLGGMAGIFWLSIYVNEALRDSGLSRSQALMIAGVGMAIAGSFLGYLRDAIWRAWFRKKSGGF